MADLNTLELNPNESVEKRYTGLLQSQNPLIEQARTSGMQQAAQRGLLNSSIAIGAAEDATHRAMLPIAQQDAQLSGQYGLQKESDTARSNLSQQEFGQTRQLQTQGEQARSALSAQEFGQQGQLQASDFTGRGNLLSQEGTQRMGEINRQGELQKELAQFNATTAQANDQMRLQYQTLLQTSQTAAATYAGLQDQIAAILRDPNLDTASKQNAVNQAVNLARASLNLQAALAGAGGVTVDTSGLLQPTGTTGGGGTGGTGGGPNAVNVVDVGSVGNLDELGLPKPPLPLNQGVFGEEGGSADVFNGQWFRNLPPTVTKDGWVYEKRGDKPSNVQYVAVRRETPPAADPNNPGYLVGGEGGANYTTGPTF